MEHPSDFSFYSSCDLIEKNFNILIDCERELFSAFFMSESIATIDFSGLP